MIRSCRVKISGSNGPKWGVTPAARSDSTFSAKADSGFSSTAVTRAPYAAQNFADTNPVRASPTTRTRLPSSSTVGRTPLPQFQSRERKQGKHQCRDPEAHDDFGFAPTNQFEMMMQRRHFKNALASQPIRGHLQNDRKRLNDEYAADGKQENFLLDDDGGDADDSPERERTDIAHEHLRGMRVVPKKAERGTDKRAAEYGQLAYLGNGLQVEIFGDAGVAGEIGENRQCAGGNDDAADGETVEAVGEIHGI